ncbi:hypothetical protein EPA93_11710 [Ktedonosporobacter rubrisoli]|uniref:Uncharacterized protein n=1 Tax=Ktedonosporobacter rubrisoli TaxID=2509675 RepID=A0A4P6JNI8_KTERU|nr:hypothetical protein [Ktedonosporobacter rubrisoli]QBD76632.1 hypothetical protein EPA93_11710 [Ktedonosporobacter rubrisoli]
MASYYGDESLSQALKKAKHYPLVTRMLIDIFLCGELSSVGEIDIEPEFGYVGRIVYLSGAVGMIRGGVAMSMTREPAPFLGIRVTLNIILLN